ncbi:MAG: hypothetical protein NT027_02625 [Proteobacteria bacterium]|nr:hypothetical protein [Pseudomonadota bacterium]
MHTGPSMNSGTSNSANTVSKGVNDLSAFANDKALDLGEKLSHLKDQVLESVTGESRMIADYANRAVKGLPTLMKSVETSIRRHPFIAAIVAVGVGALTVKMASRQRISKLH